MKYLPFENIIFKTKLNSKEISKRLNEITEPKSFFRIPVFFRDHQQYEGVIGDNIFTINRIINYRNSFLPIIKGTIQEGHQKTKIFIQMRPHLVAIIFMLIWFGVSILICTSIFITMLFEANFTALAAIPFGILILSYVIILGGYNYESNKSIKYLAKLFEAEIIH